MPEERDTLSETDPLAPKEFRKRKREIAAIVSLSLLFVALTIFEVRLLGMSQQLPFVHSIFFFGLVNFNIILLLLLFFLIFRNLVKVFVESRGRSIGRSLKGKLIAAFVVFASVPTALMFLVSVFYINSSFDKWFSVRMATVLRNSLEVNQEYVFSAKKRNFHFAQQIAQSLRMDRKTAPGRIIETARRRFGIDAVEYYPGLFGARSLALSEDDSVPSIPPVSLEFLRRGIASRTESSTIHHFGEGNLVRVIVPVNRSGQRGAVVVSTFLPISLIARFNDIAAANADFRDANPLEYPIKSIYIILLALMTLVILLCATWFGFHLARELSVPLEKIGRAAERVATGNFELVQLKAGSNEVNKLIESFNMMVGFLSRSREQVNEANRNMKLTLDRLDERARYVQAVLDHVTTGVISIDEAGTVSTVNRHAAQLIGLELSQVVGRKAIDLLPEQYRTTFRETLEQMRANGLQTYQREMKVDLNGRSVPLQINVVLLQDEQGLILGQIIVFDDLTVVLNAQRAAAWTEVARRIAHEIKNPLTPIKLSAQRLERKFSSMIHDPAFSSSIRMIIKQTDDLKRLVNEFSNFARLPQAKPVLADLNQTISEALTLYREAHREIDLVFEPDSDLPRFLFDPDQISRAMINVIDNAVHAVSTVKDPRIIVRSQYDATLELLRVSVIDNGIGIGADEVDRVFEPYYSTKESGTGLGLAIVRRIIEDHSGFIRAVRNDPSGTRIIIELPVASAQSKERLSKGLSGAENGPLGYLEPPRSD